MSKKHGKHPPTPPVVVASQLENVTPQRKAEIVLQTVSEQVRLPLPPPPMLRDYEEIRPGCTEWFIQNAERALAMAEGQSKHRQQLECRVIGSNVAQSWVGQIAGTTIAVMALYLGYKLLDAGRDVSGFALLVGGLGTLLYANISARTRRDKELRQKAKQ